MKKFDFIKYKNKNKIYKEIKNNFYVQKIKNKVYVQPKENK